LWHAAVAQLVEHRIRNAGVRGSNPFRGTNLPCQSNSGYILARMAYAILLSPEAVEDLRKLTANVRSPVRMALETHLRHEPGKTSRSRIKRLRGLRRPQYRLRVGEVRVFYDISGTTVEVLAIVAKSEAQSWLAQFANPE
jgi:mRNA interferase RelE/StbE